ncbi:hypothetical protein [Methanococcus aeolicus]|uniref:Uncharacterized protein n=1 Tax=Methanococcus aeolicus (strain ATCC BAA-1280 / DSM 17508 / OCM 812 / Nankai-3) TaxID=419665 RepID=A6UV01_META3|nr:hypothetical protein [Methanococcus aeolicus]ABR56323.1 conserved hypothetical protein [Methanococcus aeolicus Nankai-3]UXM84330.1 hypothetical protein N6C89_06130 [Methanococcus aeolicus]
MKKYVFIVGIIFLLVNGCNAMNYKWSSTIPIEYIPLSSITSEKQFDYYLNNENIVIFYTDKNYLSSNDNIFMGNDDEKIIAMPKKILMPIDAEKGIYGIKPKKILMTNPINPDDKDILDFVGNYVSENNGSFAYINKVPPKYEQVVINGVAVQKVVPDENGEYAISVAKRKIKVDMIDDKLLTKKINSIKSLSELLNINITYISTGSENIKDIKKENIVDNNELNDLLNNYWFKKWYNNQYTHIQYTPSDVKTKYNAKNLDILAMSHYPMIYVDKAPETFENDPTGGYYPETISYEGPNNTGYWQKGAESENNYYHYEKGEPNWNDNDEYNSNWYYEGSSVSPANDTEMNNRYEYFNYWFVKNYAYALSENVDGLLLYSNDKTLYNMVFGKENKNMFWKLNIGDRVDYVVIPGHKEISKENNITIIKVPGLLNNEVYGVHYIKEYYLEPHNEEFGVYVADSIYYDKNKIYALKDNYTWICSFKNYADWSNKYTTNNIVIKKGNITTKYNENIKITIYNKNIKDINNKLFSKYSIEEYNNDLNKIVIENPPKRLGLNN